MGDVISFKIGNDLCSRFDVKLNDNAPSSGHSYANLQCVESNHQEAGHYNVSQHFKIGYSNNSMWMRRSSLDPKEYFEFTVLPRISSVTPTSGNIGGQYLTIKGTGFSIVK